MQPVLTGIDVLRANGFAELKGLNVGLVTNHTGRARDGATTIDLLAAAPGMKLVALFSPEHGIRGVLDSSVPSSVDEKTGLPIHSLYGATQRPTPEMLNGIDAMVIDLQDIGARFYTYMTTMAYVMEEAAKRKIRVIVLDRPNPIGGVQIEGPALDDTALGFTGYMTQMPIRPALTLGELGKLFNDERKIGVNLTVIEMRNWVRDAWYDETGLPWINPSPNMRTMNAATLYPGIGAFESTNLSVGRGTDTPFEHVGAPWINGLVLADALNAREIPGVRFYPVTFTPASSKFAKEECHGVFILITDREAVRPVRVGVEIASALLKLFPGQLQIDLARRLFGSTDGLARLKAGRGSGRHRRIMVGRGSPVAASARQVRHLPVNMKSESKWQKLPTEAINRRTLDIDTMPIERIVALINREDRRTVSAVEKVRPQIVTAVKLIVASLSEGGRVFFVGAGTSGRLGVLEAAEVPPTFGTPPTLVRAVIAGGEESVFRAREGAEDNYADGVHQMTRVKVYEAGRRHRRVSQRRHGVRTRRADACASRARAPGPRDLSSGDRSRAR